jgi:hypothetical protein
VQSIAFEKQKNNQRVSRKSNQKIGNKKESKEKATIC